MAIGDNYASLAELKDYLFGSNAPADTSMYDEQLNFALTSTSREIERYCDRQFNQQTTATPRIFEPSSIRDITVDDFWTQTNMVLQTDPSGVGSFVNTWVTSDYEVLPYNGISSGQPGWPYNEIHSTSGLWFPIVPFRRRGTVQLTAQWGWAAVPSPVHQACLLMASLTFKAKDAPFGVAGTDQFGTVLKVTDSKLAVSKLQPYRRSAVLVG
jgi:hypothetical protein